MGSRAVLALAATGGDLSLALTCPARTRAQAPLCQRVKVMWQQEAVATAFARLYPPGVFEGFSFPFTEDIINGPPFSTYFEWREQEGLPCGVPLPPAIFSKRGGARAKGAYGVQVGTFSQRQALPHLVSFGLSDDDHFSKALEVSQAPTPPRNPSRNGWRPHFCGGSNGL